MPFSGEKEARIALENYACGHGLNGSQLARDATLRARITFGDLRDTLAEGRRRVVGSVRVENVSPSPLHAPVVLVLLADDPSLRLIGADGYTCDLGPFGSPYVILSAGLSLDARQSVEVSLAFENPYLIAKPRCRAALYEGTGDH